MAEMARMIELQQQNKLLRQQVRYWKEKFQAIQKEYKELAQVRLTIPPDDNQSSATQKNTELFQKGLNCKENQIIPTEESQGRTQKDPLSSPTHSNDEKDLQTPVKEVPSFQIIKKEQLQLQLSLITGCFLIQKRRSCNYNPIKHAYPCEKEKDYACIYDAIYRFVFIDEAIQAVVDDQQGSRKNQIFYGSTYEDFYYVFDDYGHQVSKKSSNQFLKEANVMRKQHVFGIVRPELLLINQQYYETEVAFGFTSQVPFYPFFRDLNRVIQQQIKLSLLSSQSNLLFEDRLDVIRDIITNICNYSLDRRLSVNKFPINLSIDVPLCTISLNFSSAQTYLQDQLNCAQNIILNYPKKKIIKILHYLLAQKSMVIICKTRKSLNQLFQIMKILIQPLNWIFPIVYSYSSFYEPFLSSPLPILIGYVKREYYEDWEEAGYHEQDFLPANDVILIKAQSEEKDSNQPSNFQKRIKKCQKWVGKDLKQDIIIKQKIVSESFAKKISENRLCYKLYYYVQQLLCSVSSSKQEDIDDFFQGFKQSQMLSYYNQDRLQQ